MYSVEYTRDAVKTLARLPRNTRELIQSKIEAMAVAPTDAPNVKKLVVRVLEIGARGGIY